MYDIQVMLNEAIPKIKDIEVCGQKGILSEYLNYCVHENEKRIETYLYNILFYKLSAIYKINGDFEDNWTKVTENIFELHSWIDTNKSLYTYAESIRTEILNEVINDLNTIWDITVTEEDLIDTNTVEQIIGIKEKYIYD